MIFIKGGALKIKAPFIIFLLLNLGACNTFSGMGKDISNSADWAKGKMSSQDGPGNQATSATQSKTDSSQQPTQKSQPTK